MSLCKSYQEKIVTERRYFTRAFKIAAPIRRQDFENGFGIIGLVLTFCFSVNISSFISRKHLRYNSDI